MLRARLPGCGDERYERMLLVRLSLVLAWRPESVRPAAALLVLSLGATASAAAAVVYARPANAVFDASAGGSRSGHSRWAAWRRMLCACMHMRHCNLQLGAT